MSDATRTLAATDRVVALLAAAQVDTAMIGAAAMAVYGYPRSTEDVDLVVCVDPARLPALADALSAEGFATNVSLPDGDDPLGGVIRARAAGADLIEIVNFSHPPSGGFPALAEQALAAASMLRDSGPTRIVALPDLILFKLYAGGTKSKNDVLELLSRNPELDLVELRGLAARFRLDRRLTAWLRELGED